MNQRKFCFIINPISGKGKGKALIPLIESVFTSQKINFKIHVTQAAKEAKSVALQAIKDNFDVVVAVGGDGTVNEVAGSLVHSNVTLGIIPIGSGNGLAREMKIPLDSKAAIHFLLTGETRKIDTGTCNGHFFICTAGIGFDAYLAEKFLHLEQRGLLGYVKTFVKEFFSYSNKKYVLKTDGKEMVVDAFLITIANCKQWGNDFFISPKSNPADGYFDICVLKKFPIYLFPVLLFRILCKSIHKSSYFESYKSKEIEITNESKNGQFHTDGECFEMMDKIEICNNLQSILIISMY